MCCVAYNIHLHISFSHRQDTFDWAEKDLITLKKGQIRKVGGQDSQDYLLIRFQGSVATLLGVVGRIIRHWTTLEKSIQRFSGETPVCSFGR